MRSAPLVAVLLLLPACDDKKSEDKADTAAKGDAKDGGDSKDGGDKKGKDGDKGIGDVVADAAGGAKSMAYLPEAATVVFAMDVGAVVKTPMWTANKAGFDKDFVQGLETMAKCEVPIDNWKKMVVGVDPNAGEAFAIEMHATGLGKKSTIECMQKEMKAAGSKEEWTLAADGKSFTSKDATGFAVNDDLVVMTNAAWKDAVSGLIDGKGNAASAGAMKGLLGRVDQTKPLWVAAQIPAQFGGMGGAAIGAVPKDITLAVDLPDGGMTLSAAVGVDNAAEAAKKVQAEWDKAKPMVAGLGVPQTVADSLKIAAKDDTITVDLTATKADVDKITETVKGQL